MIALLGTNTYPIKSHNFESMIFPTSPGSHASEGGSHQGVRLVKGWGGKWTQAEQWPEKPWVFTVEGTS